MTDFKKISTSPAAKIIEVIDIIDRGSYQVVTCPGIFRPSEIRDNGSLTARSSDEESTIYGRADRSHIARS